ncbi:hypothetical protein [Bremerella cremea]|uniref:beta-xylosidase family glycoside hydrolase n=1 Tax=Bremerella cremea TaxID=1031537 RepID=UPI0031E69399
MRLSLLCLLFLLIPSVALAEEVPGWGIHVDPVGNCPVDFLEKGISITVPGGMHDMNPKLGSTHAPRIWNEVNGDFLYEVQVKDFARPKPKSGVEGAKSYIAAGILVWQDEENLFRWTRSANGDSGALFLACEQYEGGELVGGGAYPLEDKPIWLRVERRGDRIAVSASYDNQAWKKVLDRRIGLTKDVKVGVIGLSVTTADAKFEFADPYLLASE